MDDIHHHHHHRQDEELRDALAAGEMDAGSRSLSDALRISFFVLKVIMVVLVSMTYIFAVNMFGP